MSVVKRIPLYLLVFFLNPLAAQQIVEAEYFIDLDPGQGLASPISITANPEISNLLVNVDLDGVEDGIHNLMVRAKDENGSWSLSHKHTFLKTQLPSSAQITYLEYYFDIDPGLGNGTALGVTPNMNIVDFDGIISTTGINNGVHNLFIRALTEDGVWSHVARQPVFICPIDTKDILKIEYFIGDDPGEDNGTTVMTTADSDVMDQPVMIPIDNLPLGISNLSLRSKNSGNTWSLTNTISLLKLKAPNLPDLVEMEYFFDVDPGLDNGTFVSYGSAPNWEDVTVLINTSSLDDGLHTLYLRVKDEEGNWSHTQSTILQKISETVLSDIVAMEYYFDLDPGEGNGNSINITADTTIANKLVSISTSGLSKGVHILYVRSKNELGEWSLTQKMTILVQPSNIDQEIVQLEYFFDTDPGLGLAQQIMVDSLPDITELSSLISSSNLSFGVHRLFVRSKNALGKWSLANVESFLYLPQNLDEDIVKIEYYFGDDPGLGNGIDLPLLGNSSPDIIDFQNEWNIDDLNPGVHILNIRSRDITGVWSHNSIQPIYVYKNPLSDMVKAEYFIDTDPGYGLAEEILFTPELDKIDHSFPIEISELVDGIYRLHVRYMASDGKWSKNEITPFLLRDGTVYNMLEGEYFFDVDPGIGMGIPFALSQSTEIADLNIVIMGGGLEPGLHDLYIRTKNVKEEWSLTNIKIDIQVETTLPLSLLSFEVEKKDQTSVLGWEVSEAFNTSHFEVQRSTNDTFVKIGSVHSINGTQSIEYNFVDENPKAGLNYYRLKIVDLDGQFEFGPIRSLDFSDKWTLKVYPNPVYNELWLEGSLEGEKTFRIYNTSQQLIKKGKISNDHSINVQELSSGAYHLIIGDRSSPKSFLIIKT